MAHSWMIEALEPRLLLSADAGTISCSQLFYDSQSLSLQYDIPTPVIQEIDVAGQAVPVSEIAINGAESWGDYQQAILPVIPTSIVLPAGYAFESLDVTLGDRLELAGNYALTTGEDPAAVDTGIGADRYEVVGVQSQRGVNILTIRLNPVEYDAQTGSVAYYNSYGLSLTLTEDTSTSDVIYREDTISPLSSQVDNPEMLASYEGMVVTQQAQLSNLVDTADSYDYLIITNETLRDATGLDYDLADFTAQKNARGLSTKVVTIEDIYANYTGIDAPEQVRNFIIDAYNGWEIDYVFLAGDASVIPVRQVVNDAAGNPWIATDLYYQCLDGPFDFDGDGTWGERNDGAGGGEVDWAAEVYIGRGLFDTPEELSNWVYKTISYEDSIDDVYRYNAMMVGGWLGHGGASEYGKDALEQVRHGSSSFGFTTEGFDSDPMFTTDALYQKDWAWTSADLVATMNSNDYGVYVGLGHGDGGVVLETTQAYFDATLTNDNFFFLYSEACWSGYYTTGGGIAEALTTQTRHGAAAAVLNSNYGWDYVNTADGPSQRLNRQFWDAMFGEGIVELGAMNDDSHDDNLWCMSDGMVRSVLYDTILFGDPSLALIPTGLQIGTFEVPIGYEGETYTYDIPANNTTGSLQWSVSDGALPDGLVLDPVSGELTGTPTTDADADFTIRVLDTSNGDTAERTFHLTVIDRLSFTVDADLPTAYQDGAYGFTVAAEGGTGALSWTLTDGTLPSGLSLNSQTGQLVGTPGELGIYTFTIDVSDSDAYPQTISLEFTLEVLPQAPGIYGTTFVDTNSNGVQDAGEAGVSGMTVELVDPATGAVIASTVSADVDLNSDGQIDDVGEAGLYSFTGIAAGSQYEVRKVEHAGWTGTTTVTADARLFAAWGMPTGVEILEIDPNTGDIINQFSAPGSGTMLLAQGLAVGPDSLFYVDNSDMGPATLYELDIENGSVMNTYGLGNAVPSLISGLAYCDGMVYILDTLNGFTVLNASNGTVEDSFVLDVTVSGGLAAADEMGVLFASGVNGEYYIVDTTTRTYVTVPLGGTSFDGGLAYVNGELIACPVLPSAASLKRFDPFTGAYLGDLVIGESGKVPALGGEGVTVDRFESYRVIYQGEIISDIDFGNVAGLVGDFNIDGVVNAADIDLLQAGMGNAAFDLDGDNDADADDLTWLLDNVLYTVRGDANLDSAVNAADLAIMATNYGTLGQWGWANGDFNGDGDINAADLAILATDYGTIISPPAAGASFSMAEPEGATLSQPIMDVDVAPASEEPTLVLQPSETILAQETEAINTPTVSVLDIVPATGVAIMTGNDGSQGLEHPDETQPLSDVAAVTPLRPMGHYRLGRGDGTNDRYGLRRLLRQA